MAGQKQARAQGVKIWHPSKLNDAVRTAVKLLRDDGMGIREISKLLELALVAFIAPSILHGEGVTVKKSAGDVVIRHLRHQRGGDCRCCDDNPLDR